MTGTTSFGRTTKFRFGRAALVAMTALALVSCGKKDRP